MPRKIVIISFILNGQFHAFLHMEWDRSYPSSPFLSLSSFLPPSFPPSIWKDARKRRSHFNNEMCRKAHVEVWSEEPDLRRCCGVRSFKHGPTILRDDRLVNYEGTCTRVLSVNLDNFCHRHSSPSWDIIECIGIVCVGSLFTTWWIQILWLCWNSYLLEFWVSILSYFISILCSLG